MSSKQRKKQASLAALKSARSGRRSVSALDDLVEDDTNNADVYEVMDETEYRDFVQRKRQREDFVVDDGKKEVSSCNRRTKLHEAHLQICNYCLCHGGKEY